ncbi:unnamed protein product, partial [Ectocarpus sp. 4 AP-2014]
MYSVVPWDSPRLPAPASSELRPTPSGRTLLDARGGLLVVFPSLEDTRSRPSGGVRGRRGRHGLGAYNDHDGNMMLISGAQTRWRRGGQFLEDQVWNEDRTDEDGEDEQDAAAAVAAAQETADERVAALEEEISTMRSLNERLDGEVSPLRDTWELAEGCAAPELASQHSDDQQRDHAQARAVERLEGINQEFWGQLEEEQRQRNVSERATQTGAQVASPVFPRCFFFVLHRNEMAAIQRRQQEEPAPERQQHQEILAQGRELLATSNNDNAVLMKRATAAERTVEESRGRRAATGIGQPEAPTFNVDDTHTQASATPSNVKASRALNCPRDGMQTFRKAGWTTTTGQNLYLVVRRSVDQCPTFVVPVQGAC